MVRAYRPKAVTFKFPFRIGGKSLATGGYNKPSPGRKPKGMPGIKQFTQRGPGRLKRRSK